MTEYIERKKLEEAFDDADPDICESYPDGYSNWGFGRKIVRDVIRSVPAADAAPVVHCKDCKKSNVTEFGKRYCSEPMGMFYGCIPVEDDFFCSGGKRLEENK